MKLQYFKSIQKNHKNMSTGKEQKYVKIKIQSRAKLTALTLG